MGGYRLESLLGRGGMAEVWLARNEKDELVALKRTPDSSESEAHEALALEARAGERLSHPGIVRCLDFGQDESGPYLVLEYVDGPSLRERLASGPLPEEEAVAIGTAVLGALEAAHARGVVHNDLKPENILLGPDGPKVTDFEAAQSLTETLSLGRVEELTATIAYLAPEVLQGASPSVASDIYSLGLTLYEAVAGQLALHGHSGHCCRTAHYRWYAAASTIGASGFAQAGANAGTRSRAGSGTSLSRRGRIRHAAVDVEPTNRRDQSTGGIRDRPKHRETGRWAV